MKRTNTAVWMEKYHRWQIKVQKDGVRKTFYSSVPGRTGQRECNAKADAWLDEGVEDFKLKVSRAADEYVENLKLTASTSHYTQYEKYIRLYIKPRIGGVRMTDLNEQHLQSVLDFCYSKKLAKKTIMNVRGCIMAFMKYCRKCKYTMLLPESLTIPNGAPVKEKQILQPDGLRTLFTSEETIYRKKRVREVFIYAFRLQVITGLRPGEILGLKWSDIVGNRVMLRRAVNVYGEETTGKNDNARRAFDLTPLAAECIAAQRELQQELGISPEWVFTGEDGECVRENRYYKHWQRFCKANEIPKTTAYELRHTFVSAVKSLPEGYLKQLVGHSQSMDTYGVYSHAILGDSKKTAELVEEIFEEIFAGILNLSAGDEDREKSESTG